MALAAVVVLLTATHSLWLPMPAEFLIVADPIQPSDAVIVLAGHSPDRARHALELFQAGAAPRILVSDEEVRTHAYSGTWSDLHRRGLSGLPVPDEALVVMPVAFSTYEEAVHSRDALLRQGLRSAVLVTDSFHSRRAKMIFQRVYREAGLSIRVSPSQYPAVWTGDWWLHGDRVFQVASEYVKMGYYALRGRLL